jgi:hypothetical protein
VQVEPSQYRGYEPIVPYQQFVGRIELQPRPNDAWRAAWRTIVAPFRHEGPVMLHDIVELRTDDEGAVALAYRLIEKTNEAVRG